MVGEVEDEEVLAAELDVEFAKVVEEAAVEASSPLPQAEAINTTANTIETICFHTTS